MAKRRSSRLPAGIEQLCLFPGDVAIRPVRRSRLSQSSRPVCAEVGHSWEHGKQMRLFGLPPEDMVYCSVCGAVYR